jgi:sulfur-oxidizing protein SoxY
MRSAMTRSGLPSADSQLEIGQFSSEGKLTRRSFLQHTSAVVALIGCGLLSEISQADDGVFRLTQMSAILERLGGTPTEHDKIALTIPELAEDGANVPVSVASSLAEVEDIYVLVEANPFPFAAAFSIPAGTAAKVAVNLKLAQSSQVIGVVRAANKLYWTSKFAKVTVGGCT